MQRLDILSELIEAKYDPDELIKLGYSVENRIVSAKQTPKDRVLSVYSLLFDAITKIENIQPNESLNPDNEFDKALSALRLEVEKSLRTAHLFLRLIGAK